MDKNSLKKYLVYAIGEVLLVVFGILVALQINSWNQQVQDRGKEKEYLASIKEDLITDTINLGLILTEVEKNLDAAVTLIKFLNQPQQEFYDTTKIYEAIRYAGFLMTFETNSPTFDDLRSTGNLKLILNMELKKSISSYYTSIESRKEYRHVWKTRVWEDYWHERDEFINSKLNAWWLNGYKRDLVPITLPTDFSISKEEAKDFLQALYNVVDITTFRRTTYSDIKLRANELIEKVEQALANK